MEYNTTRSNLRISEYGRNIQKMVDYTLTIEDKEVRTQSAKLIVAIMGQLNPLGKDSSDFKQKLWDHLHIISDYKLDVDSEYPKPQRAEEKKAPLKPTISDYNISLRNYGRGIGALIEATIKLTDETEKSYWTLNIANQLKRLYLTWNKESVSDELILAQLKTMSGGQLVLEDDTKLKLANELVTPNENKFKSKQRTSNNSNNKRKNYTNRNKSNRNSKY